MGRMEAHDLWNQPRLCWELQQSCFQRASWCPRPGGFVCSLQRGSTFLGRRNRVQEEKQHHGGYLWGWRGMCEPSLSPVGLLPWAEGYKTQSQASLRGPLKM